MNHAVHIGLSGAACRAAARGASSVAALCLLAACASKDVTGYGVGPNAERAALSQQVNRDPAPDTPGMYLGLIDQMQTQGLYFASLAHIDAYEKQYGASPDSILLRADALRMTDQPAAAADSYAQLLNTPLAARGYRGLGLIAGAAGDFGRAAEQLQQAARIAPTDPLTLSDLGYARLRAGDVNGARVPLMKAIQLDQKNPKIVSNLALFLMASGDQAQAQVVMNQQKFPPDLRVAIRNDAVKVAAAARTQTSAAQLPASAAGARTAANGQGVAAVAGAGLGGAVASAQGIEPAPRVLQRFAQ